MIDRYGDVIERLDREMLERQELPSHVTAARQLTEAKIEFKRIVAVNPDAILFTVDVGDREMAWTAWSEVKDKQTGNQIVFYRQTGFPAFPSPYLKDTG